MGHHFYNAQHLFHFFLFTLQVHVEHVTFKCSRVSSQSLCSAFVACTSAKTKQLDPFIVVVVFIVLQVVTVGKNTGKRFVVQVRH